MKKGYTLVELLAVIVIISLIGIITVPIATSYIEKSRVESYRISVENVIEVAKEYVAKEEENHDFPETGISVKKIEEKIDGKIISGRVKRNEEGVIVAENIYNGTYCASGSKNSLVVTKVTNETECGKLDITPPSLKVKANNVTNSSITVVAIAKDETEIKSYQYCIGDECSKEINQNHYTFTKLKSNKTYKIKVTVKNENSGKEGYDANTTETTQEIEATTKGVEAAKFKVSGTGYSGSKEVTIIYPEGNYEYRYEIRDIEDKNTKKTEIVKGDTTLKIQENCIIKAYVKTESEEIESEITVIGIDSIGPEVYVIMNNNWEKQKQISVIAIDTGSGLMSKAYSYDGGKKWTNNSKRIYSNNGVRVQLAVRDKLGNITTKYKICESIEEYNHNNCKETAGIIIDKVDNEPPTCKLTVINGTLGKNGWYRSDIKIGFAEVNDTQSGVKIQKIDRPTVTQEGIITIQGKVEDKVGNVGTCNIQVKIDKTKPSCGSWTGESTTWTRNVRTIQVGCSDSGSGCTANQFTAKEYKTGTIKTENIGNIQIEDRAGNINTCSKNNVNVYVDHDAPTCTSSGGNNSWTNDSRTLIGTCGDSGSGCQGNASWYINWEGSWINLSPGTVYDKVGNATTCPSNQTVKIDKTAPSCSVTTSGGTAGSNGWYKKGTSKSNPITITGTCNDTGSGCQGNVSKTRYKDTNGEDVSPGIVRDNAGNETTCNTVNIKIDTKNPSCTSSGGNNNWTNDSRTLIGTCNDSESGCQGSAIWYINWEGNWTKLSPGTVLDNAGNSTTCPSNQTVRIDKTAPKIKQNSVSVAKHGLYANPKDANDNWKENIYIKHTYSITENGSGISAYYWGEKKPSELSSSDWKSYSENTISLARGFVNMKNLNIICDNKPCYFVVKDAGGNISYQQTQKANFGYHDLSKAGEYTLQNKQGYQYLYTYALSSDPPISNNYTYTDIYEITEKGIQKQVTEIKTKSCKAGDSDCKINVKNDTTIKVKQIGSRKSGDKDSSGKTIRGGYTTYFFTDENLSW